MRGACFCDSGRCMQPIRLLVGVGAPLLLWGQQLGREVLPSLGSPI